MKETINPSRSSVLSSAILVLILCIGITACGGGSSHQGGGGNNSAPFGVTPTPQAPLMTVGSSISGTIIVLPRIGTTWNGVIDVSFSGLPSGMTISPPTFSVDTSTQNPDVPVTLAVANSVPTGVYELTVTGTSGSLNASAMIEVDVSEPPPQASQLSGSLDYSFTPEDGNPSGPLIADSAGNLYGVDTGGDAETVYELSFVSGVWQKNILYTFTTGDVGANPVGSLVFDASGNLYGVTRLGGSTNCGPEGCGAVYELTRSGSSWQQTVLHNFTGAPDGYEPGAGLVMDKAGNLYGTTSYGGSSTTSYCQASSGCGTVFELSPTASGWSYSVIYSFQGMTQGSTPDATLIVDQQGNVYGTTEGEGYQSSEYGNATCNDGCGTVFELSPTAGGWQENTIYSFVGLGTDGVDPTGVVMDSAGNLYGTTTIGGFAYLPCAESGGNFYQLTPSGNGWNFTSLYNFFGCNLGYSPVYLVTDGAGNFYGAASGGPAACSSNLGCGVVYKLSSTSQGWVESAYYDFPSSGLMGAAPMTVVLVGGKLYGTALQGGTTGNGVIFEVTP